MRIEETEALRERGCHVVQGLKQKLALARTTGYIVLTLTAQSQRGMLSQEFCGRKCCLCAREPMEDATEERFATEYRGGQTVRTAGQCR